MRITKFGHCCLLIEEKGVRVLTDPGTYTTAQDEIKNVDVVLITHEHADHFHIDSVKKILENNPEAQIVTNSSVNALLEKEGIVGAQVVEDTQSFKHKEISFLGCGTKHEEIYKERGQVMNTGYFIGEKFYYGGDSFFVPPVKVEVLALPLSGPWVRIKDVIDFALSVKPKEAFPVHDILLNEIGMKVNSNWPSQILKENGINFSALEIGKEYEF
jgi:L-ascorbate metabolism protein UlaG (beta-lactamase superfamily)